MEWIISGLIALLWMWCIYCVVDHHESWMYYHSNSFKELKISSKLKYITYQFVKWTSIVTMAGVFFVLVTIGTKLFIFG